MSWAKFDDHFDDDPDCDIVGTDGICLFLCSITWASRNNTDGDIPAARARKLPGFSSEVVRLLLSVRWWVETPEGFHIRNYLKYNKSRAQIEAEHEAKVNAGRNGGQRSGEARRGERPDLRDQPPLPEQEEASAPAENEASALALAKAQPQAKTKPVSRIPYPSSRVPEPEGEDARERAAPSAILLFRDSFREKRRQSGKPVRDPTVSPTAGNDVQALLSHHGPEAFQRALTGFFSGLDGADTFPERKGFDITVFVKQFDTWEGGSSPSRASPPNGRNGHAPSGTLTKPVTDRRDHLKNPEKYWPAQTAETPKEPAHAD